MEISHDKTQGIVSTIVDKQTATLRYIITQEGINIISTFVPSSLEGKGIASQLTQTLYDYALENKIPIRSSCSYGAAWLSRRGK